MTVLRVGTWNLYEYDRHDHRDPAAAQRYTQVAKVLTDLDVDVIAVQEVCGRGRAALEQLAKDAGMFCWYDPPFVDEDEYFRGRVAFAGTEPRPSDFHVGLLWNPARIRARVDGFRPFEGGGEFWHAAAVQEFRVDGLDRPLVVGSYHGTPFQQDARPDEARRIVSILTRPYGENRLAIIGGDWNSISADRVHRDGEWQFWHPDPYWIEGAENVWREPFTYQCIVTETGPDGMPVRWHADRRPGEVLMRAGCRDTAALAGAAWAPSVGHADHADMGYRTLDTHRVSPALTPAVADWQVVDWQVAREASDHLPVVTTLDLSRLES
ncbi:hypothetical protein GCM10025787_03210 [Saccharopolyspora rosea]|uniref:Endonuclease/exonuclease/phosphatase family protein n=1 Tax=Saccharopolyspora rosea TaxID=524884 RepID=A0ABW3FPY4_9PSEU